MPAPPFLEHNAGIWRVGEISHALKTTLEETFSHVRVRGEISGFKRAASGHVYMGLCEGDNVLDGVCWRNAAAKMDFTPEDGLEVIATGRITTYGGRSKYQIVVSHMEMAGAGAILKRVEDRRRALAAEGLFDDARKKPLPTLPRTIGVITSPTGAVIRDILHRLRERFPCRVLVWPVAVQGKEAAGNIAAAVAGFNALRSDASLASPDSHHDLLPDLLIIARGGGSVEDMMPFNEEAVIRAVADSTIPLITAIGHESDTTLADYAADVRAPTPTAAAEMAVPERMTLMAQIHGLANRLNTHIGHRIEQSRYRLQATAKGLCDAHTLCEQYMQRLDEYEGRLARAMRTLLHRHGATLLATHRALRLPHALLGDSHTRLTRGHASLLRAARARLTQGERALRHRVALMHSYSHERVLERGFAIVQDDANMLVRSRKNTRAGQALSVCFHDGTTNVVVQSHLNKNRSKPTTPTTQGRLL